LVEGYSITLLLFILSQVLQTGLQSCIKEVTRTKMAIPIVWRSTTEFRWKWNELVPTLHESISWTTKISWFRSRNQLHSRIQNQTKFTTASITVTSSHGLAVIPCLKMVILFMHLIIRDNKPYIHSNDIPHNLFFILYFLHLDWKTNIFDWIGLFCYIFFQRYKIY